MAGGEFAVGVALQSTCFEPKLRAGLILYLFRDRLLGAPHGR